MNIGAMDPFPGHPDLAAGLNAGEAAALSSRCGWRAYSTISCTIRSPASVWRSLVSLSALEPASAEYLLPTA